MRNLNFYRESTSDFLEKIVDSKRNSRQDPDYKDRIYQLIPNLKILYNNYDTIFSLNKHESLVPFGYINQNKNDLLKLYSSSNSILVKFKNSVTTILDNRFLNICQYCTITTVGSLDHIVPKEEFPEFSVNPKNLIPSCTTCNSHKKEHWKLDNKTIFLNLYTDVLPEEQYLFVELEVVEDFLFPRFYLRNSNNIDPIFFELLESHYTRLHLFSRFAQESNKIISELTNLLKAISNFSIEDLKDIVQRKLIADKETFGKNYYKSILEEALINNQYFLDHVLSTSPPSVSS